MCRVYPSALIGDEAEDIDGCSVIICKVTDHPTGIYISGVLMTSLIETFNEISDLLGIGASTRLIEDITRYIRQ